MIKKCVRVIIGLVFLPMAALSLSGCSAIQSKGKIIKDIIYTHEVPVAFETLLICKVDERAGSSLRFNWSSENGTMKSNGPSTIWVAPSVPGTYNVGVNVTDGNGWDDKREVRVQVVPFGNLLIIDASPEIALQAPIWGNGSAGEQQLMVPLITAEIECNAPLTMLSQYKYEWACNGGRIQGPGVKEGKASKIGWAPPGVPGYYTVMVTVSNNLGTTYVGCVYFNVVDSACCPGGGKCGGQ